MSHKILIKRFPWRADAAMRQARPHTSTPVGNGGWESDIGRHLFNSDSLNTPPQIQQLICGVIVRYGSIRQKNQLSLSSSWHQAYHRWAIKTISINIPALINMSSSQSEPEGFRSRNQEFAKRLAVRRRVIEEFEKQERSREHREEERVKFTSLASSLPLPKKEEVSDGEESIDMFGESEGVGGGLQGTEGQSVTDQQGYYFIYKGKTLQQGRYQIQEKIGKGVFGIVARVFDNKAAIDKAIKVMRKNPVMEASGQQEYAIVKSMRKSKYIVGASDCFREQGHLFLVSQLMGQDLRSFTHKFQDRVGLPQVKKYAVDMFMALHELRKHHLIHADIKPDNFLLTLDGINICLTDFGTAFHSDQFSTDVEYLVARYYRPPEIILGCQTPPAQRHAIDTWAVGCSLYELLTGQFLFQAGSNHELLALILQTKGRISLKMIKKCQHSQKYFDTDYNFLSPVYDPRTQTTSFRKTQPTITPDRELLGLLKRHCRFQEDPKQLMLFSDFLQNCLTLNPKNRFTPQEAFRHPFLNHMATLD